MASRQDLRNESTHMGKRSIPAIAYMAIALAMAVVATLFGVVTSDWPRATMLATIAVCFVVVALFIVQKDSHAQLTTQLTSIQDAQDEIATRLAKIEARLGILPRQTIVDELAVRVDNGEGETRHDATA